MGVPVAVGEAGAAVTVGDGVEVSGTIVGEGAGGVGVTGATEGVGTTPGCAGLPGAVVSVAVGIGVTVGCFTIVSCRPGRDWGAFSLVLERDYPQGKGFETLHGDWQGDGGETAFPKLT